MGNISRKRKGRNMFKNRLPRQKGLGIAGTDGSECVVFCKKVGPNSFDIKDGFAILRGDPNVYDDGVCMVSQSTKIFFVFE